ncbi:MAG: argininosuccinate lyase [Bacteroidetes bacterium]|nr:argininosuccinate lyase [Bacteroidota bacterium]
MLWGGRFSKNIDDFFLKFSSSIQFDIHLLPYDLKVSRAHSKMLGKCGIISKVESEKILNGLDLVERQYIAGNWNPLSGNYEDIHSAVEDYLYELIGEAASKLHTARSRNDQVATGFRMWIKDSVDALIKLLTDFQITIITLAEDNIETIIPGYTHLQRAQPISLAFHLMAYVEMLERDKKRFQNVYDEADVCPLGSGALAGTTFVTDRSFSAQYLGFTKVSANSLDSVSDRDFVLDYLNACSIGMMHLSRLAEELILWSTVEWDFIQMDDSVTTGSSLMPQKKNPDAAELIRGKFGRVQGNYLSVSSMMKGLPLSYNRDMQEDKEPAFESYKTYSESLKLAALLISSLKINKNRFSAELKGDFMLSTDLADWLVSKNIPFRQAHSIIGKVVAYSIANNKKLNELSIKELKTFSDVFDQSVKDYLDIETALNRKKSFGSPNPLMVSDQIKKWKELLEVD